MKFGLFGYPNAGKKTLFELLTGDKLDGHHQSNSAVAIPGMVKLRDQRLERLAALYQPQKLTPATIEFVLAPNLTTAGENANNGDSAPMFQALALMDVLAHVVRDFKDDSLFHLEGSVEPGRDIESINNELVLRDLIFVEKRIERLQKEMGNKALPAKMKEMELLQRMVTHLEQEQPLRIFAFTKEEKKLLSSYTLLTRKPMMIILNLGEGEINDTTLRTNLQTRFTEQNFAWVQVSAKIERELAQIESPAERNEFLHELGIETPALEKLTRTAYHLLGMISYFTVGKDEVRAWMVKQGANAPQAARAIHADLERGFIRAEMMKYQDLIQLHSEAKVKEAGRYFLKGKDYLVEDGDILSFRFNV